MQNFCNYCIYCQGIIEMLGEYKSTFHNNELIFAHVECAKRAKQAVKTKGSNDE